MNDTLKSVLRQHRADYVQRPEGFPQSVVLYGVRDMRDYRIHSAEVRAPGDPIRRNMTLVSVAGRLPK